MSAYNWNGIVKTKKEIADLKRQLRAVKACNGECLHCESCQVKTATVGRVTYMAFECLKAPALGAISDRPSTMRAEIIEALEFELS